MKLSLVAWSLGIIAVGVAGYLGLCGYLFVHQRQAIYQPGGMRLGAPPAGSGYRALEVEVPGAGTLTQWWTPPSRPGAPTVVFFHGNASDRTSFLQLGQALHAHGWGVVLGSYPGYSGNPGKPTQESLLADARATLAALAPQGGPVIVWGHSLGSGVAARMAAEKRAAGLVLEAPYTALTDVAGKAYPLIPVRLLMLDRFDTASILGQIQVPVLIFHSTDDPVAPFAMGQALADALGPQATFVRMTGAGHSPHHHVDLSEAVVRWAGAKRVGG